MNIVITQKIESFINSLDKPSIEKVARTINLLEKFGNRLSMPHSKHIESNLSELRIRGKQEVRIFYCFGIKGAYLLHGIVKKSQKTPSREIVQAIHTRLTLINPCNITYV